MPLTKTVFVPVPERPFYREHVLSVPFTNASSILVSRMREVAGASGMRLLEASSAGDSQMRRFSAFFLPVVVDEGFVLPLEAVYQYSKVWEGVEPVDLYRLGDLYRGKDFGSVSRASKAYAREKSRRPFKGFVLKLGEHSYSFPTYPHDAYYNWLYSYSIWRNDELYDLVRNKFSNPGSDIYSGYGTLAFSDIYFARNAFSNQAKSLAMLVGMRLGGVDTDVLFPSVSSLREMFDRSLVDDSFRSFVSLVYG